LLAFANVATAQIEVVTNGRVRTGNPRTTDDPNNETTVNIYGLGTDTYRVGSKMSFGDYGRSSLGGANVFIGELGATDTDQLQLHGKNGIVFTVLGAGNYEAMRLTTSGALHVRSTVTANSSVFSDSRLKDNVHKLSSSLAIVKQLQGVSYDLKPSLVDTRLLEELNRATPTNEKEQAAIEQARKIYEKHAQPLRNQIGFIAQDVARVLPAIVNQGEEEDYLSLNYIAIIPILVEAIKEQQVIIESLTKRIEQLEQN
jgi:hypothetical protein